MRVTDTRPCTNVATSVPGDIALRCKQQGVEQGIRQWTAYVPLPCRQHRAMVVPAVA